VSATRGRLEGLTAEGLLAALLDAPARDRAFLGALAADRLEEVGDARAAGLRLAARRGWWPEAVVGTSNGPHRSGSWDWRKDFVGSAWPNCLPHAVFGRLGGGWSPPWAPMAYREYPTGPAAMLALLDALAAFSPEELARLQGGAR
jgi:hypothetical protein